MYKVFSKWRNSIQPHLFHPPPLCPRPRPVSSPFFGPLLPPPPTTITSSFQRRPISPPRPLSPVSHLLPSPSPSSSLAPPTLRYRRPPAPVSPSPPGTSPLRPPVPSRSRAPALSGPSSIGYRSAKQAERTAFVRPVWPNNRRVFVRPNRIEQRLSVWRWPPFDQTDGLRSACLTEQRTFVRPNRTEQRLLFGPVWPNGVKRKAGAEEGGAGLMPGSEEETEPKEEGEEMRAAPEREGRGRARDRDGGVERRKKKVV